MRNAIIFLFFIAIFTDHSYAQLVRRAESDPQVGAVTNNKWCIGDGSAVQCTENPPAGYTNLTSFVDQTAWQLFYSNGSGDVTELGFGASGKVLKSNGATAAPTWEDDAQSAGDVTKWNAIADADGDNVLALGGFETDFTSTLDSAGKAILTITNTDADTAADTDFISLAHNDGADANVFYFRAVGDADGTPQTDYLFSQTAATIRPNLTVTGTIGASNLSGTNTGDQDLSGKADKLGAGHDNELPAFDATGNLITSQYTISSDFGTDGDNPAGTFLGTAYQVKQYIDGLTYPLEHAQNTDSGTSSNTFQIGIGATGPVLKNNATVLEIRNEADNAYAPLKSSTINTAKITNLTSNGFVKTSGSDGTLSIDTNAYLTSEVDGSTTNELQNIFETVATTSGTNPVADTTTDTLTLTAGTGITVTGDSSTDTVTIASTVTDTNANTLCSGTTTYLDGDGNCDDISSVYQPLDADLTSIAGNTTGGFLTRTSSNTYTARTIGEGAAIDVTNGDGVSGAPSIAWDSTEVEATTWGAGGNASNVWTFNVSGTDTTMTAGSGLMSFSHDIAILGDNIEATTETDRFVFMANGSTYAPEAIDLGADTTGGYAASTTEAGGATSLEADAADALTEIAQGIKTATDDTSKLVVGTAGSTNEIAKWDSTGALIDTNVIFGTMTSGKWCSYNSTGTLLSCTENAPAGSGDITDVGPGCASGACFTDGVATTGGTLAVWEGSTVNTKEISILAAADPTVDTTLNISDNKLSFYGESFSPGVEVLIGSNTSYVSDSAMEIQSGDGLGAYADLTFVTAGDGSADADLKFYHSGGDLTTRSIVSDGDAVGSIVFAGYDGASYRWLGRIVGKVDGTPGSSDMPGLLDFQTIADGGSSPTTKLRLDNAGALYLGLGGVKLTNDDDGALTFLGLGDGASDNDENLTLNFEDTANTIVGSSSTGVNLLSLTSIGITTGAASNFSAGTVTLGALAGTIDAGGATSFEVPNSTTLPATCVVGQIYMDTDATSGQRIYVCESTNTWVLQGDGNSGGGAPTDATYITQTANGTLSAEQALSSLSSGIMRVATTTGVITSLTDSSGIASNISDETGSGVLAFATAPTFTTSIKMGTDLGTVLDANGNELFILDAVTSAVNEMTIANAATGNKPTISTSGGDTNIGLTIALKGDAPLVVTSSNALTSASSFPNGLIVNNDGVSADANGDFQVKGDTDDNLVYVDTSADKVGIGDSTPAALFTVGASDKFQVDGNGDVIKLKNVTYVWPSSQGSASTVLTNDGSGNLTWTSGGGAGDVTSVGDCTTGACFGGASGTTLTSTTSEILDLATANTLIFQRNDAGSVTFTGKDDAGAADTIYDTTGAGAITVGSGDVTAVTVTTDGTGTAEVALPAGSIDSTEILDNTITGSDTTDDTFDFVDFEDTLDLDAALTLNQTTNTWSQTFTGDTTTGLTYTANSLTSGNAISVASSATGLTAHLVKIELTGSNAGNTGGVLKVGYTGTVGTPTALNVTNGGTGLTARFNTDGTYTDASTEVVIDNAGNVGIGDSTPAALLTVGSGDLFKVDSSGIITAAAGITATGSIDFSGATFVKIVNGTNPTVDAAGKIAQDTTDDQLIYGATPRVLAYETTEDKVILDPVASTRYLIRKARDAWTITNINCIVDPADSSESIVIALYESDSSGDFTSLASNGVDGATTITCSNTGASDDGALSNGTIAAGNWIGVDLGTVTGTVSSVTITYSYTQDRQ